MIKHIIFDFDGTLADSSEIGLQIFNEFSGKYRYKQLTVDELRLFNNKPLKDRFRQIGIPMYKIPQIIIDVLARYRLLLDSLKTFAGIRELLIDLKTEGFTLSIISSNNIDNIENFIEKFELKYFDNIISSRQLFGKHITIKAYLKKFKLKPNEIVYIGDELRDIEACKKASVKIIVVTWGFDSLELLKSGSPDFISFEPRGIIDILNSIRI